MNVKNKQIIVFYYILNMMPRLREQSFSFLGGENPIKMTTTFAEDAFLIIILITCLSPRTTVFILKKLLILY